MCQNSKVDQTERSENIDQIAAALCAVQQTELFAIMNSTNPFYKSRYADLSSCWSAIRKPLTDAGLSICQFPEPSDPYASQDEIILITLLMHTSGQWIRGKLNIPLDKRDPQAVGKAYTYGRRYMLSSMIGLCPADDDAESAIEHDLQKAAPKTSRKTPKNQTDKLARANEKFKELKETNYLDWKWCCINAGLVQNPETADPTEMTNPGFSMNDISELKSVDEMERFAKEWKLLKENGGGSGS